MVQYLSWEDPLEKEMATHFNILAWRIPGTGRGGAWWASIYGVAQSRTRLKQLSSSSNTTFGKDCPAFTEFLMQLRQKSAFV